MSDLTLTTIYWAFPVVILTVLVGRSLLQQLAKWRKKQQPLSMKELELVAARLRCYVGANITLERMPPEAEPAPHELALILE